MLINQIPLNDQETWDLISSGNTKGLFQLESRLCQTWAKKLQPRSISELSDLIAVIRPGSLQCVVDGKNMAQKYADRKRNREEITYIHPSLEPILRETYGICIYQEQIMRIAQELCGYTEDKADELRKAVGKKSASELFSLEQTFVEGANNTKIISQDIAIQLFQNIKAAARYSFNRSHSVFYAITCYQTAYIKTHRPIKFYKHWLRWAGEKLDPKLEKKDLILDAKSNNIEVRSPNLELMNQDFVIKDGVIYFAIGAVKGVGERQFEKLTLKKEKDWPTMLFSLLDNNKTAVENLVKVGICDNYNKSRTEILHELSCLRDMSDKELEHLKGNYDNNLTLSDNLQRMSKTKKDGGGVANVRRLEAFKGIIDRLDNPGRSLQDNPIHYTSIEKELLGIPLSCSEMDGCLDASFANTTCVEFKNGKSGDIILAGTVTEFREHTTKNSGEKMCFVTLEDDSGELGNIVIFPNVYSEVSHIIYSGSTILLHGKRSDKNKESLIVDQVHQI